MKNYIALICFSFLLVSGLKAQQDFVLYNMYDVPQSAYSNPSNQFNGKFYIGLPILSSSYYSISNSGFAYSDAIKKRGDSLVLDFNSLIAELEDENFTSFSTKLDLFSFGISLGDRTQLSFNVTENIYLKLNYTKDFIRFVYEGNGAFEDNVANFENIGFNASHYREFGVGLSHQFTNKLRLGTRLKYLYGLENIYSKKTDIRLTTNPETYALTAEADVEINTSGVSDFDGDNYVSGRGNTGFGIDFGANYEVNKKLSLNASVLDLGYISWNHDTKNYIVKDGEYTYSGIELNAFTGTANETDTSGDTSFDRVLDSLEEAFDIKETEEGYSSPLTSRIYIGANYRLREKTIVGGLFQSEFFQGKLKPSFTASINQKFAKWFTLGASYTVINRSYNNLGLGININPGPVQFYIMSDNIISAFRPQHARHAQVRLGINLIFGGEKTKELHPSFDGVNSEKRERKRKKKADDDDTEE